MSHVEAHKCGLHVSFSQNGAKCRSRVSFPSTGCATNPRCSKTLYAFVPHGLTLIRAGVPLLLVVGTASTSLKDEDGWVLHAPRWLAQLGMTNGEDADDTSDADI